MMRPTPTDVFGLVDYFEAYQDTEPEPDLFDRLTTALGWTAASRLWWAACDLFDRIHAPEEFVT